MIRPIESKVINATEFNDYLGLSSNPMFLNIDEKKRNQRMTLKSFANDDSYLGLIFVSNNINESVKIDCLGALAIELRNNDFILDQNWQKRVDFLQQKLYP